MIENLQEMEDEGEIYESIEDLWPDYPSKEDFFFNEEKYWKMKELQTVLAALFYFIHNFTSFSELYISIDVTLSNNDQTILDVFPPFKHEGSFCLGAGWRIAEPLFYGDGGI